MQKASDLTNRRSRRGRLADGRPNQIDLHIGSRIRQRRSAAMVFNLLSEMAKNNYCGDADNE